MYDESYPLITRIIRTDCSKKAWLTSGLRQSIKTKNKLHKRYLKRPITYGPVYRTYRNTLTKLIRISKNKFYQQKFINCNGNIKETWKNINNILGRSNRIQNQVFKIESRYTDDPQLIANNFNEYLTNIPNTIVRNLPPLDANFEDYQILNILVFFW